MFDSSSPEPYQLSQEEIDAIERLKVFLGQDINSSDSLELLVSLNFLKKLGRQYGSSDEEILSVFREKKPYLSEHEIQRCWRKLNQMGL